MTAFDTPSLSSGPADARTARAPAAAAPPRRPPTPGVATLAAWCVPLLLAVAAVALLKFKAGLEHPPHPQAAIRHVMIGLTEAVWRYNGPRPGPNEHLAVYTRQGNRWKPTYVSVIAYTAGKAQDGAAPVPSEKPLWRASPTMPNYLAVGSVVIPGWSESEELYVGLQFEEGPLQWWELGTWPSAPLDALPWQRLNGGVWKRAEKPFFMGLDVRVRPNAPSAYDFTTTTSRLLDRARPADAPPPSEDEQTAAFRATTAPNGKPLAFANDTEQGPAWSLLGGIGIVLAISLVVGMIRYRRDAVRWALYHLFLAWLLAQSVAVFWAAPLLWSGFHFQRIGEGTFLAAFAAILLATFPPLVAALLGRSACCWRRARWFVATRWTRVPALVLVTAGLMALFWSHPCRSVYGDGYAATAFPGYDYHNPLATTSYQVYFKIGMEFIPWLGKQIGKPKLELPQGYARQDSIPPFNLLFAPMYILGAWVLASALGRSPRERLSLWLIVLTMKPILCQFRYIEIYGPSTAVAIAAIALVVRALWRKTDVLWAGLACYAAFLFHLAFAPAVALCAAAGLRATWHRRFNPRWLLSRVVAVLCFVAMLWLFIVAILFTLKYDFSSPLWFLHMPRQGLGMLYGFTGIPLEVKLLQPTEKLMHYSHEFWRGSKAHLGEWGNAILFCTGPVLVFLAASLLLAPHRILRSIRSLGAAASALGALYASYVLVNSFAQVKDWDVFSPNATIATLCTLCLLVRGRVFPRSALRWALWALLVYQLCDTGLWVYYNVTWGVPALSKPFIFG